MKFVTAQFNTTIAANFSATSTQFIGPLPYVSTGLRIGTELALTNSSGVGNQDWLARQYTAFHLVGGGRQYIASNAAQMRLFYWMQRLKLQAANRMPDIPATATVIWPVQVPFAPTPLLPNGAVNWFALNPDNYNSTPTIMAGAMTLSISSGDPDLTFDVTWGTNSATQSSGTLTTGTGSLVRLSTYGVILDSSAQAPKYYPVFGTDSQAPTAQSGLGWQYQLPTSFYYRRTLVMPVIGASPADLRKNGLSASLASQIAIELQDGTPRLNMEFWDFARDSQMPGFEVADDNSAAPTGSLSTGTSTTAVCSNAGIGLIDWRERSKSKNPYGIYPKVLGSANINWTVDDATNAALYYQHERYLSY